MNAKSSKSDKYWSFYGFLHFMPYEAPEYIHFARTPSNDKVSNEEFEKAILFIPPIASILIGF